jgi:RecB family exonuclease
LESSDTPTEARREMRRIRIASGPLAVERALLDRMKELLASGAGDLAALARPVRLVVPSRSLRLHVSAALVRELGAVAGVTVSTLYATALEILERCGVPVRSGDALLPVWSHRFAREEPALRDALEDLVGGYEAVDAVVRDLLDAGLRMDSVEPLLEAADALRAEVPGSERVSALVRVADRARRALEERGVLPRSALLTRAAEAVAERGAAALPARAVLVHGFADATGVATDLIVALQSTLAAEVWLDRPPAPDRPAEPASDPAFGAGFRERVVLGSGAPVVEGEHRTSPPTLTLIEAPGERAQWRAAAERARALMDRGVVPERIALVVRRLEGHEAAARAQLDRVAVPSSGIGATGPGGAGRRRLQALLALLRDGARTSADRWLDARGDCPRAELADLRMALRALAASRLDQVARLAVTGDVSLPVRVGLEGSAAGTSSSESDSAAPDVRAPRRRVGAERVRGAVRSADRTLDALGGVRAARTLSDHVSALRALVAGGLGWADDDPPGRELEARIAQILAVVPDDEALAADEWVSLVTAALDGAARDPFGGSGGGVAVLSVMEARARTFDHLILVDVRRNAFPRPVLEDPLLPDAWRHPLRAVLPDLPLKSAGTSEERFLFAQLLASSPGVTICWPSQDDAGQRLARSPLVERLGRGLGDIDRHIRKAPGILAPPTRDEQDPPRTALDWAIWRGLESESADHGASLEAAWRERRHWGAASGLELDAASVAASRDAILAEVDRVPHEHMPSPLGPFFGLVGPVSTAADPRHRAPTVTLLESLAHCGWKTFVERLLRIEPTPDPTASLPEVDARIVGSAVHAVLDDLAREALGAEPPRSLEAALEREAVSIAWPEGERLERRLDHAAARTLLQEGVDQPGLRAILVERMRDFVETARARDPGAVIVASELGIRTVVEVPGLGAVVLGARVDRVERTPDGALVLVDYKTGRPLTTVKSRDKQDRDLKRELRTGRMLQAALYSQVRVGAIGRYEFLKPDLDDRLRQFDADSRDAEIRELTEQSIARLAGALASGAFLPRLVDPENAREPDLCRRCEVAEACLRGDSAARRRLEIWSRKLASGSGTQEGVGTVEAAAAALERGRWSAEGPAS